MRLSRLFSSPRARWMAPWLAALCLCASAAAAQAKLLIPMDDRQTDHLKAYGLTYWVLAQGQKGDWLLNYRGGSFLLADTPENEREANIRGVSFEQIGGGQETQSRAEIAENNMESVAREKAAKVAGFIPPNTPRWSDAARLAPEYAQIPNR